MSKHLVIATLLLGACATADNGKVRNEISAKLSSAQTPIQACYQKQLYVNRKLRGMYVVQLAVNADNGAFTDISLRRDEPADPVLRFCVINEIARLKLDKPPGKRVEVDSIPIKFEPSNP
jgi:hypothetical protein